MGGEDVQLLQPEEVRQKMAAGETFVLNVVTDWCPDCSMRQHPNLPGFVSRLEGAGLLVFQLTVQQQRLVFLSDDHEKMVERFGGHGYPRTILIVQGKEVESAVEVMTGQDLTALADRFINLLQSGA
ncbi:MAG: thioredoxin family protein [Methylococcales bacterium]|nr:thioredoxin family protein [Methylococcales bacterium]